MVKGTRFRKTNRSLHESLDMYTQGQVLAPYALGIGFTSRGIGFLLDGSGFLNELTQKAF